MTQEHFFGNAKWVGAKERTHDTFSVLRGHFNVENANKASINLLGLGFFKCYINGICINPDTFLPLSSDYENTCDPRDEVLAGHRIYVPTFDITPFIKQGDNTIDIHFGGGWYTLKNRPFGLPKAIYRISVFEDDNTLYFCSDENCLISKSYVTDYDFVKYESHAYANITPEWEPAVAVEPLITEYCRTDCPHDALIKTIAPQKIGMGDGGTIYDCGENTTGYPVLDIPAGETEKITVLFSEKLTDDGKLDMTHHHKQKFTVTSDGEVRTVQPEFTWFGFRYNGRFFSSTAMTTAFRLVTSATMLEALVLFDRSIPIGVGKEPCHVSEVHNDKMRLAILFSDTGSATDNLLEGSHTLNRLV